MLANKLGILCLRGYKKCISSQVLKIYGILDSDTYIKIMTSYKTLKWLSGARYGGLYLY